MKPLQETKVYVQSGTSDMDYYLYEMHEGDLKTRITVKEQSLYCFTKEELVKTLEEAMIESGKYHLDEIMEMATFDHPNKFLSPYQYIKQLLP